MRITKFFLLLAIAFILGISGSLALSVESQKDILQADLLRKQQKHGEAILLLEATNKKDPGQTSILYRLSEQYSATVAQKKSKAARQKTAEKAIALAKEAIDANPKSGEAHLALAVAYGRLAETESPRQQLQYSKLIKSEAEEAAKLNPRLEYAWHIQGRWHYEIATLNPVLRGVAQLFFGKIPPASLETSIECFKKAIAISPQRIAHHVELGRAYLAISNTVAAKKEFEIALKIKPEGIEELKSQQVALKALKEIEGDSGK